MQNNDCFSTLVKELYIFSQKEKCRIDSLKCFLFIIFNEPTIFISDYLINRNISQDVILKRINELDPHISVVEGSIDNDVISNDDVSEYLSPIFYNCGKDLRNDIRKEHLLKFLLENSSTCKDFCSLFFDCKDLIEFLKAVECCFYGKKSAINSFLSYDSKESALDLLDEKSVKFDENEFAQNDNIFSYFHNITDEIKNYPHHPAIGREKEISKIVHILNKKNKPNCILIGEAGVGKTAIVEGLAYNIVNGIGENGLLEGREIYSLNICQLISGTSYRGQVEERISKILNHFELRDDIILFIDEIHMIVGAGGKSVQDSCDLSNILKPYLSRGKIICIGATTYQEYNEYIYPDSALERRFSTLEIDEPTVDSVKIILNGIKEKFEQYHEIRYGKNTIKNIISICEEFFKNRKYPDKAIDILDSYGAYLKLHSLQANKKSFSSFCLFYLTIDKESPSLGFSHDRKESIESIVTRLVL